MGFLSAEAAVRDFGQGSDWVRGCWAEVCLKSHILLQTEDSFFPQIPVAAKSALYRRQKQITPNGSGVRQP